MTVLEYVMGGLLGLSFGLHAVTFWRLHRMGKSVERSEGFAQNYSKIS